jgi:hypothetical protein
VNRQDFHYKSPLIMGDRSLRVGLDRTRVYIGAGDENHIGLSFEEATAVRDWLTATLTGELKLTTLRDFGYVAGNYSSTCMHCEQQIDFVDKRCRCCKPCAERHLNEATA